MSDLREFQFYLCPDCLTPSEVAGECENCGGTVLECRPGDANDPCRRPIIDSLGNVRTRAPLWWLRHRIGSLIRYYE